jgi:hypothetical protein
VLVAQGNLTEALQAYRDSLAIRERLAKACISPLAPPENGGPGLDHKPPLEGEPVTQFPNTTTSRWEALGGRAATQRRT